MAIDRDKVLQAAQKLVDKKRYDKAIVEYQKLVADDPKDARTLLKIGDLYSKLEQYAEAIATYERVGQFYSQQGFALKAIAVYKQIRELIVKHVPQLETRFGHIVPRLAEIYTQLGLTSDALAAYDEVATRLQRNGRDRDAIDIFRKVVDLDPANPLPYLRLAEAFVRVKDLDNAVQRFGAASEILIKLGRQDDALKVLERLLQYRQDARFAKLAAEVYLERNQPNDGMAALTKLQIAFKETPKDLDTLALLARAFDKLQQPAKAIEVQKEAARIAKDAGKHEAFASLVDALARRAPQDDGVRQLIAQAKLTHASVRATRPQTRPSIDIEVDEIADEISFEDDSEQGAPFPLRNSEASIEVEVSHASIPQAPAYERPLPPPRGAPPPPPMPLRVQPSEPQIPLEKRDPAAYARALLTQAEALRKSREFERAATLLRTGLELLPGLREFHEKLCDVLIEGGDHGGAIRQMLSYAQDLAMRGEVENAARVLDEVLLLEPAQPDAIQMLASLGYAVPTEVYEPPPPGIHSQQTANYPEGAFQEVYDQGYDPSAPLPSYDLEEISAADALSPQVRHDVMAGLGDELDDPFANEAPLPSFPIEEESTAFAPPSLPAQAISDFPLSATPIQLAPQPSLEPAEPPLAPAAPSFAPAAPSFRPEAAEGTQGQLDEDAMEEIEFFSHHGMLEEARNILEEQLNRLPNHPLLLERQREVLALMTAREPESGARQLPRSSLPNPMEDRSFDIAASLEALDALDTGSSDHVAAESRHSQVSVETVFEQFKAGIASQISESDALHYDLGVAYKGMQLFPDAINEFELAARDPARECVCRSMIGLIHLELGNLDAAIDSFIRGLQAAQKTVEQEVQLTYEIANAYELRSSREQALYYFQRIMRIDPRYRDPRGAVDERIARLQSGAKPARAVGTDLDVSDEFDAAFDELLDQGGKLP